MSEPEVSPASSGKNASIHWLVASVLCVVALLAGVLLGRVAFVNDNQPAPQIVSIEMQDEDSETGGKVEYLEDSEVYILTTWSLTPAPDGTVYKVWMQTEDLLVPVGILNPNINRFAYAAYDGRYDTLFVTKERAPFGTEAPTSEPLFTVDLTEIEIDK